MSIRVLIADDHEVVRTGLKSLLQGIDIEVVAEAADGKETVTKTKECLPDIVLLDIRMPEVDGLEALDQLTKEVPTAKVIVLSTYDNPTYMARAVTLGAKDYILKGTNRETLIDSIHKVAAGQTPQRSPGLEHVAAALTKNGLGTPPNLDLTRREIQVLRHVALGLSNKEVAQSISVSVETVKEHVQNLLRKLRLTDRTQAAVWAVKHNIV